MSAREDVSAVAEMLYSDLKQSPGVGQRISVDQLLTNVRSYIKELGLSESASVVLNAMESSQQVKRFGREYTVLQ